MTLSNCAAYPYIRQYIAIDHPLDQTSVDLAKSYGISREYLNISTQITQTITDCFEQYCNVTSKCGRDVKFGYGYIDICGNLQAYINPDVGGIGVRGAPWLQHKCFDH